MLNVSSFNECESLAIDRDKFPMRLESGTPFLMPREFEFLSKNPLSTTLKDSPEDSLFKSESLEKYFSKQTELALARVNRMPNNAHVINNLGVSFLNSGDHESALLWFEKAIEIDPNFVPSLANLAKTYLLKENFKEALNIYKRLEKIHPEDQDILNNIAHILIMIKDLEPAKEYLRRVIKQDSNNAYALNNLGLVQLIENNHNKALHYFRRAITIKSNLASAYSNIGVCFALRENYGKAIRFFRSSLSIEPLAVGTILNLAQAYQLKGNYQESVKLLSEYRETNPHNIRIAEFLAWSYFSLKDYHNSLRILRNLVEKEKLNEDTAAKILNNIAVVYQCTKDDDLAEKYFNLCIDQKHARTLLYFQNLICFYLDREKVDQAKKFIDLGLLEYPDDQTLMECLGRYYFEVGKYEISLEILYSAVSRKPELIDAYTCISVIEMEIKRDNIKAHDILTKGLERHPGNKMMLNNLAYNYLLLGDIGKARTILDGINEPENIFVNATRGLLLIKEENVEEGRRLYNLAEKLASNDTMLRNLIKQKKHLELAKYHYSRDEINKAADNLKQVIRLKAKYNYYAEQALSLNQMISTKKSVTP